MHWLYSSSMFGAVCGHFLVEKQEFRRVNISDVKNERELKLNGLTPIGLG